MSAQETRESLGSWGGVGENPYPSLVAGLGIGVLVTGVVLAIVALIGIPFIVWYVAALWSIPVTLVVILIRQLRRWNHQSTRQNTQPMPGGEKQLLMAIRNSGGLTTVEAALETSLTVDEAEEILSRLADRGHLFVQSHDGALFYTLPGRRPDAVGERTAPQF